MLAWLRSRIAEARLWWRNERALQRGDGIFSGVWLWVDATRPAPHGWYWARSAAEAQGVLTDCFVERLSVDHGLGAGLMKWLVRMREESGLNFWPTQKPRVHSAHTGRAAVAATVEWYGGYGGFTPHWHHTVRS